MARPSYSDHESSPATNGAAPSTAAAAKPPPLPPEEIARARHNQLMRGFATAQRTQPPPRRAAEPQRTMSMFVPPPPPDSERKAPASVAPSAPLSAPSLAPLSVPNPAPERQMPSLAVSNDALLASLRPAAPDSFGVAKLLHSLERWATDAGYWFGTRAGWQRSALSLGVGAVVGLGLLVGFAKALHLELVETTTEVHASLQPREAPLAALAAVVVPAQVIEQPAAAAELPSPPEVEAPSLSEVEAPSLPADEPSSPRAKSKSKSKSKWKRARHRKAPASEREQLSARAARAARAMAHAR